MGLELLVVIAHSNADDASGMGLVKILLYFNQWVTYAAISFVSDSSS
jgi:hypothetical protein